MEARPVFAQGRGSALGPGDLYLGEIGGAAFYVDTDVYER